MLGAARLPCTEALAHVPLILPDCPVEPLLIKPERSGRRVLVIFLLTGASMDAQVANLASRPRLCFLHAFCQICSAELLCPRARTTLLQQRLANTISASSKPTDASPGRSCWRGCDCFCPMLQSRLGRVGAEECSAYLTGSNTVLPCQTRSSIFYS